MRYTKVIIGFGAVTVLAVFLLKSGLVARSVRIIQEWKISRDLQREKLEKQELERKEAQRRESVRFQRRRSR